MFIKNKFLQILSVEEDMDKTICKVCCDVCDCVHNENGCICQKEEISVTNNSDKHHFCGSYKCKN